MLLHRLRRGGFLFEGDSMRTRGFEIVSVYRAAGIHLPERKTGASTGYDFAAAEAAERRRRHRQMTTHSSSTARIR